MRIFKKICLLTAMSLATSFIYAKSPSPLCVDATRDCMIQTADAYLKGLIAHDAKLIPLADDAKRIENGINTGKDSKIIRNSIENDYALKAAKAIRDLRWFVDGNQAIALYLLDVVIPYTNVHAGTTRIAERFQIENGLIKEIEVIFCNAPGLYSEERETNGLTPISYICTRA